MLNKIREVTSLWPKLNNNHSKLLGNKKQEEFLLILSFVCLFVFYPPWMFSTSCQPLDCGNWFLLDLSQLCALGHWQSTRQAEQLPMIQTSHLFSGNDALSPYSGFSSSCLKRSYKMFRSSSAHPVVSSSFWPIGVKIISRLYIVAVYKLPIGAEGSWCTAKSLFLQKSWTWFADWLSCWRPVIFANLSANAQTYLVATFGPRSSTISHRGAQHFERVCWSY